MEAISESRKSGLISWAKLTLSLAMITSGFTSVRRRWFQAVASGVRYGTMLVQQPCTQTVPEGQWIPSGSSTHWVTPGPHSVPLPAQKIAQASPESPPWFWSPSWAMTWMRYEWPEMRPTSNRSSAPYPCVHALVAAGTGSADEVRFHRLGVGSAVAGVPTWLASSVPLFHVPKTATGS